MNTLKGYHKVAIYARFSSHAQREESIDQQLRACRRYAQEHEMTVVKEYSDSAISGRTDQRPSFQRMIDDSSKGQWKTLLVYSHDRFARNRYDSATYKAKLKKNGVSLIAVTLPLADSPESVLIESMMEGYAEYYSVNLSRNVKRGMDENALNCKSNGGTPLGYTVENGDYVLDPVGAKAVRIIYDMYDAGKKTTEIADELNQLGYKSRSGKKITPSGIRFVLKNEKYTGVYIFDKRRIDGGMPAIIEKDQWDRVQKKIKQRKARAGKGKAVMEYLLSGKIFCGKCGSSLVGESGKSKNGDVYRYYKCSARKKKGTCKMRSIRKEELEKLVINAVVNDILTDTNIQLIAEKAFRLIEKESQDKSLLKKLEDDYRTVNKKIKNILSTIEDGYYNPAMMERLSELEREQAELENKVVSEKLKTTEFTQEHIEFWLYSFKSGRVQGIDQTKAIIDSLINSIFVYEDEKSDELKIVVALNLKNSSTIILRSSDMCKMVDQSAQYPNLWIQKKYGHFFMSCLFRVRM